MRATSFRDDEASILDYRRPGCAILGPHVMLRKCRSRRRGGSAAISFRVESAIEVFMLLRSVDRSAWIELRLQGTGSAALLFALRLATPTIRLALDEVSFARRDLRRFTTESHHLASGEPTTPRIRARDLLSAELRLHPDTAPGVLRFTADLAWARAGMGLDTAEAPERVTASFEVTPDDLEAFATEIARATGQRVGRSTTPPTPRR